MRRLLLAAAIALPAAAQTIPEQTLEIAEALRWQQGADLALAPIPARLDAGHWLFFHLGADDLETLLEAGLARHLKTGALALTGARAHWNPLRPWPDRIFALELWSADRRWRPVPVGQGLFAVVVAEALYDELRTDLEPWLRKPAARHRSGQPLLHPTRIPDPARALTDWRQSRMDQLLPPTSGGAGGFGYRRVLNLQPATWFGRTSVPGWLFGLVFGLLAGLSVLLGHKLGVWSRQRRDRAQP